LLTLLILALVSALAAINGFSWATLCVICSGYVALLTVPTAQKQSVTKTNVVTESSLATETSVVTQTPGNKKLYRVSEINRVKASLLANSSILITGETGCGKSVLAQAVVEGLEESGFKVVFVEPASTKQMLLEMAYELDINTQTLEGKALNIDQLKRALSIPLEAKKAFLVIDDAHSYDLKFRIWLKQLKSGGANLFLLATNPPKSDIFINIPRIQLQPLPESAIREIMEEAAHWRGINLTNAELSQLQGRASGNPALAQRAVNEEYLGLEGEEGDHDRYFDITPLILLVGIMFVVMRFIGLGTNNQALYIFSGISAAVFMGVSRLLYSLPPDSKRIR
jgi:energy-coupling factor transporter ATP-binding protein EcfA2